jgi:hypothetical protein
MEKSAIIATVSVANHSTGKMLIVDVIEGEMSYYVGFSKEANARHSPRLEYQLNTERAALHENMTKMQELCEYGIIWMRSKNVTILSE